MELVGTLLTLLRRQRVRLTAAVRQNGTDAGMSTLEIAVIALGLLLVAGLLVAAITAAVRHRIDQIT